MDDLNVIKTSVMGSLWILHGREKLIAWVRRKFKPTKSRSFVVKRGKTPDNFRFSISLTMIPALSECPVKRKGKIFNDTLRDTSAIRSAVDDLELWLTKVDESRLPGRSKVWIYQHAVIPRVLWPLFVHDSPMTTVAVTEKKINGYLRRCSVALYGTSNALQFLLKDCWRNLWSRRLEK